MINFVFFNNQIKKLKEQLAEVAENKRFLLQGGDCAELFEYCSQVYTVDSVVKRERGGGVNGPILMCNSNEYLLIRPPPPIPQADNAKE